MERKWLRNEASKNLGCNRIQTTRVFFFILPDTDRILLYRIPFPLPVDITEKVLYFLFNRGTVKVDQVCVDDLAEEKYKNSVAMKSRTVLQTHLS